VQELLAYEKLSPSEQREYKELLALRRQNQCMITTAQIEGEVRGEEKGRAEGLAEGEEKGEAKALKNVVLSGKRTGLSVEQIQELTGLSRENVESILAENAGL
jgi:predicted transposase YdaD